MRTGVDEQTLQWLTGWEHCLQSIGVVLRTRLGTDAWARDFGAAVKELQDANAVNPVLIAFARDAATAIEDHEPGYRLTNVELTKAGRDGAFAFVLSGDYYPRGHLGDYSVKQDRSLAIAGTAGMVETVEAIAA
jgi:hypothetical protein